MDSCHFDRPVLIFVAIIALACITKIASSVTTICLAANSAEERSIFGLAVTAAVFDIASILVLLLVVFLFLRRSSPRLLLMTWVSGVASCLFGALFSLIAMACAARLIGRRKFRLDNEDMAREVAAVGLAVAILGLIPQAACYVVTFPRSRETEKEVWQQRTTPPRSVKRRSISVQLGSLGPSSSPKFFRSHSEPASPSQSAFSSSPRSSFRGSAHQVLRPMTSKTRLLLGTSWASARDTRSLHSNAESTMDTSRNHDDFQHWDTSAVEDSAYESALSSRSRINKLETIPGSRSVSPAYPLEGPFAKEMSAEETHLPESPLQSPAACVLSSSETGSVRNLSRCALRRPSNNDQAHIHPLFRSESPVPPPVASPGTVITASPWAGHVVSPEILDARMFHSASGDWPCTSALLSPARSRQGSMKSTRTTKTLPPSPADTPPHPQSMSRASDEQPND